MEISKILSRKEPVEKKHTCYWLMNNWAWDKCIDHILYQKKCMSGCMHWRVELGIGIWFHPNTRIRCRFESQDIRPSNLASIFSSCPEGKFDQTQFRGVDLNIAWYSGRAYLFVSPDRSQEQNFSHVPRYLTRLFRRYTEHALPSGLGGRVMHHKLSRGRVTVRYVKQ